MVLDITENSGLIPILGRPNGNRKDKKRGLQKESPIIFKPYMPITRMPTGCIQRQDLQEGKV